MMINGEPLSAGRIKAAREQHGEKVDGYLERLRLGDPLMDNLLEWLETLPPGEGMGLLQMALAKGLPADAPAPLRALFDQIEPVPAWVDWDLMRDGSAAILQTGLLVSLVFATYALPHTFLATQNLTMAFTGELLTSSPQRFARTSSFVVESFMPGGLRREADGFAHAIMVRMIHSSVRRKILRSGNWNVEAYGLPLNQAHMSMNVVFFSLYVLRGLQRLGVQFSQRQIDGVLHTWRYVGHLFGLDSDALVNTEKEAEDLVQIGKSLEYQPDETSRKLCHAMFEGAQSYLATMGPHSAWLKAVPHPIARYLLGKRLADDLGIPSKKHLLLTYGLIFSIRFCRRFPNLAPQFYRDFAGIRFWLECSE